MDIIDARNRIKQRQLSKKRIKELEKEVEEMELILGMILLKQLTVENCNILNIDVDKVLNILCEVMWECNE